MPGLFLVAGRTIQQDQAVTGDRPPGVPRVDGREVPSGSIFCRQRGCRRSDLPPEYGPARTPCNRCKRRSEAGTFARIFAAPAQEYADLHTLVLDVTHVKAHRIAANGGKNTGTGRASGRMKGVLNSGPHLVRDRSRRPVPGTVSAGNDAVNVGISRASNALSRSFAKVQPSLPTGHDAERPRERLRKCKVGACIPPRENRRKHYSRSPCETRNLVARCFTRIKLIHPHQGGPALIAVANPPMPRNLPRSSASCRNRHLRLMESAPQGMLRMIGFDRARGGAAPALAAGGACRVPAAGGAPPEPASDHSRVICSQH